MTESYYQEHYTFYEIACTEIVGASFYWTSSIHEERKP